MSISRMAVIPARGGSTRLKDKNVYPLGGKPLIAHTIEAVIQSESFDKIIVSTDSEKIAEVARSYKEIEIYDREAEFSGEKVTVLSALLDMMQKTEKYDQFAYFLPTCPFRQAEDIRKGVELLKEDVDSVISTKYYDEPPQVALIEGHEGFIYPVADNLRAGLTNSKYIQKYLKPNGGFYMGWWDKILENGHFYAGNIKTVVMSKEKSVDIDDAMDMQFAQIVYDKFFK